MTSAPSGRDSLFVRDAAAVAAVGDIEDWRPSGSSATLWAMVDGRLVWDSDTGSVGDDPPAQKGPPAGDGVARVRREIGGRGGKTVTTISGIQASATELASLAKQLKRLCGVGGSVVEFVIELQGDQRDRVMAFLADRGYTAVRAGG